MARHNVRGPNGVEVTVDVPGDMDERTFKSRVDAGELTVLSDDKGRKSTTERKTTK